jgi:glycogen phosphorylase
MSIQFVKTALFHYTIDMLTHPLSIAYFSMEIAIDPRIPNYAGGLGILAGDTLKSTHDLGLDMIGVTLLYKYGYFHQSLDALGKQTEQNEAWDPKSTLQDTGKQVTIHVGGETAHIKIWQYTLETHTKPTFVYFLDTDLPQNSALIRSLSYHLYPTENQLLQEVVLGIGGYEALKTLGHAIDIYHLNETHASLVILPLIEEYKTVDEVKKYICFTTHTPLKGGHEHWSKIDLSNATGKNITDFIPSSLWENPQNDTAPPMLNMAKLCLAFSKHANGVALKHEEVSQAMYPEYVISSVTNGIHTASWISPHMAHVFDAHIPNWRTWSYSLRQVLSLPSDEIIHAHNKAKNDLIARVNSVLNDQNDKKIPFDTQTFTMGFARRAAPYKRHDFIFSDVQRLQEIAKKHGTIQIVFAGKAYPSDAAGKQLIERIYEIQKTLGAQLRVCYLPNYDMELGRIITSGVDLWLNTPTPPLEASGTSGMKAAASGVPSLSLLDGWWIEGCIEGVTGWAIGSNAPTHDTISDAENMYEKLEKHILPLYYTNPTAWQSIMLHAIAINGSYFHTHRMVMEYLIEGYIA